MNKILMAIGGVLLILGLLTSGLVAFQITDADLVDDAYVSVQQGASKNFGDSPLLNVKDFETDITYIKFNIDFQMNMTLNNAELTFSVWNNIVGSGDICVNQVLSDWNEDTITYINKPNYENVEGTCLSSVPEDEVTFNVTPIVQNWIDGIGENFGFAIVADTGWLVTFISKEAFDNTTSSFDIALPPDAHPPTLTLDYTVPDEVPDDDEEPPDDDELPIDKNNTVIITPKKVIDPVGIISQPEIPLISWFLIIVGAVLLLAGWFSKGR